MVLQTGCWTRPRGSVGRGVGGLDGAPRVQSWLPEDGSAGTGEAAQAGRKQGGAPGAEGRWPHVFVVEWDPYGVQGSWLEQVLGGVRRELEPGAGVAPRQQPQSEAQPLGSEHLPLCPSVCCFASV